jgi:large repetitive protein
MHSAFGRVAVLVVLVSSMGFSQTPLSFNSGPFGPGPIAQTSYDLRPSGGTGPYTFSYAPGATVIPGFRVVSRPEIRANASADVWGALVGLPLTPGTHLTTIRLTDSTLASVDKAVTVTVTAVDIGGSVPTNYGVGDTVSEKFWGIGGNGGYSYSVSGGSLPPGLNLNTLTGEVRGTIGGTGGSYSFNIRVQDSLSESFSRQYTMPVSPLRLTNFPDRLLPNGHLNQPYSETLIVTGGTAPYTFAMAGSSLQNGLSLSPWGVISGTPTSTNINPNFTVNVADSASPKNQVSLSFTLNVLPQTPQTLWITNAVINDAVVGTSNTIPINATGGLPPYTFALEPGSTLPDGTVLRNGPELAGREFTPPGPGYLCGIAQAPGLYSLTVKVTDGAGNTASRPYNWRVSPIGFFYANLPQFGMSPLALGTPFSQYLIPLGGTPPYTIAPINIPAGMSVNNAGLLYGAPAESGRGRPLYLSLADSGAAQLTSYGSININSTNPPVNLSLSGGDLGVAALGDYSFTVNVSGSPLNPPNYTVTKVDGALPPGLELLTGKNFPGNNNNPAMIGGVLSAAGSYKFTLRVTDGAGNFGEREYRLRVSGLNIMNNGLPNGSVGVPYSQTLEPRGGMAPYTFSLTNGALPTGLTLNPSTGVINGTPQTTSAISIGIGLSDINGDYVTRSFTLNIYSLQITNPNLIPAIAWNFEPFSYRFVVDPPDAYQWSVSSGSLPDGLTLNPNTGVLSGMPAADPRLRSFTITASNASASVSKNFSLFSSMRELAGLFTDLPTDSLGDCVVGSRVYIALNVNWGTPPYTVTALSALPSGLALVPYTQYTPTGNIGLTVLAGIPTTAGNHSFRLRYTDSAGISVERTVRLNVTTLGVATTALGSATYNTFYSAQLQGVGGSGSYAFALVDQPKNELPGGNELPAGLSLASDGTISGIPSETGPHTFAVTVSSGGVSREVGIALLVNSPGGQAIFLNLRSASHTDVSVGREASAQIEAFGGSGTHNWRIVSGSLPPGMQLLSGASLPPNSTSPPNAILAGAPSAPGTYRFALRVDDSTGKMGVVDTTLVVSPLRIAPINWKIGLTSIYPLARVGVPYSFSITSLTGRGPFNVAALPGTYLPAGISLSSTGVLSGTPTAAGNFMLNLLITDADGKTLRISNVDEVDLYVATAGAQMGPLIGEHIWGHATATVGVPFTFWPLNDILFPGTGTPPFVWTVAAGSLPPGLSIVSGGGSTSDTISGTATVAGSFTFGLRVTDANGKQSYVSDGLIEARVMGISPGLGYLPPATVGAPYSQQLTVSGCTGGCAITPAYYSDMPPGLSLTPAGLLSGVPTTYGPFNIFTQVVDSAGNVASQWQVLDVPPPAAIASVWLGLKNSDDQGTQFDLRAEIYRNGNLVSASETGCITGLTRNANLAKSVTVSPAPLAGYVAGEALSLKLLTRIGTNRDGTKCSGPGGSHSNAVGLRLYFDAISRASAMTITEGANPTDSYYLHSTGAGLILDSIAPTASAARYQDSAAVSFAGGNAWKEIGTWGMTAP